MSDESREHDACRAWSVRCQQLLDTEGWDLVLALARGEGEDRRWAIKLIADHAPHLLKEVNT